MEISNFKCHWEEQLKRAICSWIPKQLGCKPRQIHFRFLALFRGIGAVNPKSEQDTIAPQRLRRKFGLRASDLFRASEIGLRI